MPRYSLLHFALPLLLYTFIRGFLIRSLIYSFLTIIGCIKYPFKFQLTYKRKVDPLTLIQVYLTSFEKQTLNASNICSINTLKVVISFKTLVSSPLKIPNYLASATLSFLNRSPTLIRDSGFPMQCACEAPFPAKVLTVHIRKKT